MPLYNPPAPPLYSSTSDPGVSNDNTQGYAVGSLGVNTSTGRVFVARSVTTGAAAWQPLGPGEHPGYIANNWYAAATDNSQSAQASAFVSGSIYLSPFFIRERMTMTALAARVTTLDGSGHVILGLWNNNPSVPNRPGTKIDTTALTGIAVSSTGNVSASLLSTHQLEAGWYWRGLQPDSIVVRMSCITSASAGGGFAIMGSSTLASVTNSGGTGAIEGVSTTGAFGTLGDLTGASFTEIIAANVPLIWFQPSSVP